MEPFHRTAYPRRQRSNSGFLRRAIGRASTASRSRRAKAVMRIPPGMRVWLAARQRHARWRTNLATRLLRNRKRQRPFWHCRHLEQQVCQRGNLVVPGISPTESLFICLAWLSPVISMLGVIMFMRVFAVIMSATPEWPVPHREHCDDHHRHNDPHVCHLQKKGPLWGPNSRCRLSKQSRINVQLPT